MACGVGLPPPVGGVRRGDNHANNITQKAREIAEMALAHTLRDKTEAAYQRGDLLDKRRRLMAEWERYCEQKPVAGENPAVVAMRR